MRKRSRKPSWLIDDPAPVVHTPSWLYLAPPGFASRSSPLDRGAPGVGRLPLSGRRAPLQLRGLLARGTSITAAMLGTEVQPAVVVVVAEIPRLSLQDALTTASAVLEPRLHPRTEHLATHSVRRTVSARFPRFRLRFQSSSHVEALSAAVGRNRGETRPLRVERHISCLKKGDWHELAVLLLLVGLLEV